MPMPRTPAFWYRPPALTARLLAPAASLYTWAASARYRRHIPRQAPVPVICVGNLTLGGAGKTPVVIAILELLAFEGMQAHALSRGYGGRLRGPVAVDPRQHEAADVGDEPLLLARHAPCVVARDRLAGAEAAAQAGAALLVMDDGFQNPSLLKDVSLLVIDGAVGFGNGRIFPAGPLREPLCEGFARADAVVLVGEDRCGIRDILPPGLPVFGAVIEADYPAMPAGALLAFAGIGRPEKFYATLREGGAELAAIQDFPDHHPYSARDMEKLATQAHRLRARLITTEKDRVRIPLHYRAEVAALPIRTVFADAAGLLALLRNPQYSAPPLRGSRRSKAESRS